MCSSAELQGRHRQFPGKERSATLFSAHTQKLIFLLAARKTPTSDFSSPAPAGKQSNTEQVQGVETPAASLCNRSHNFADWIDPGFVNMDSVVGSVIQLPGVQDYSEVRLQSKLGGRGDWDKADTQHALIPSTCVESETLVGNFVHLACSVLQRKLAERVAKRKL